MTDPLAYYTTPGPMTEAGPLAVLLNPLPADVAALRDVVQGLLIHIFWARRYGVELDETRQQEVQIRALAPKLERIVELDPRPLAETRPPARRGSSSTMRSSLGANARICTSCCRVSSSSTP